MTSIELRGAAPEPLASYLLALGVFRIVAEQADRDARASWRGDAFVLESRLDEDALVTFFADEYGPSPVVAPWNGGSGFHAKDNREAIGAIEASADPRLEGYRRAIRAARTAMQRLGLEGKPAGEGKHGFLEELRASLPDDALAWLDAAVVLTSESPRYPPLLGTGGNDGRLDFTNNQMQRLVAVLFERPRETSRRLLQAALFGAVDVGLDRDVAIGQFHPAAAGGANQGEGFSRNSLVNPWAFVLMIEGALLFAGTATRRWEGDASRAFAVPFTVWPTGAGYGSSDASDEGKTRCETWVPLWLHSRTLPELRALLGEGRATVGERNARTGVDFARAVATLGIDRGVREFVRYAFQERNGLAYIANPVGRWRVRRRPDAELVTAELDDWIDRLRRAAGDAPASIGRAARAVDAAILDLCAGAGPSPALDLLIALGQAERRIAAAPRMRESLRPVPPLAWNHWIPRVREHSPEFRLAEALASAGIREALVPLRWQEWWHWLEQDDGRTVWRAGSLVANLLRVVQRDEVDAERGALPDSPIRRLHRAALESGERTGFDPRVPGDPVSVADLAAFVRGECDDRRLESFVRGLSLLRSASLVPRAAQPDDVLAPFPLAVALAVHRMPSREDAVGSGFLRVPGLISRLAAGQGGAAMSLATRRLRASGIDPATGTRDFAFGGSEVVRRVGAALAFPVSRQSIDVFLGKVIRAREERPEGVVP